MGSDQTQTIFLMPLYNGKIPKTTSLRIFKQYVIIIQAL